MNAAAQIFGMSRIDAAVRRFVERGVRCEPTGSTARGRYVYLCQIDSGSSIQLAARYYAVDLEADFPVVPYAPK